MDSSGQSTLPFIKNLLLLDSEGKRIAVKYYSQDWWACVLCFSALNSWRALSPLMHTRMHTLLDP